MNKITVLSIVTAAVLFVGCGDDTKKAASEATAKVVESTKTAADSAGDVAKKAVDETADVVKKAGDAITEATDKAVKATKEAAEATKEVASKAADSVQKSVAEAATATKAAVADATGDDAGAAVFKKCAGCHGTDGKTKALGKSAEIAGESKEDLVTKISEYKAGTRDVAGMGALMKGQVASLNDEDIQAVAGYISNLK